MATTKSKTNDATIDYVAEAKASAEKIIAEAKAEAEKIKAESKQKKAKQAGKETAEERAYWREPVSFYAIKDDDQYKDDIVVGWNGRMYKIQRGKEVKVPRAVYQILMESQEESAKLADTQAECETSFKEFADRFGR